VGGKPDRFIGGHTAGNYQATKPKTYNGRKIEGRKMDAVSYFSAFNVSARSDFDIRISDFWNY
jgi:hypothetical protein